MIVHVARADAARRARRATCPTSRTRSRHAFWPGPLTLVVRAQRRARRAEVTGGRDTVGLRVPDHPVALALLDAFGGGSRGAVGEPLRPGEPHDRRARARRPRRRRRRRARRRPVRASASSRRSSTCTGAEPGDPARRRRRRASDSSASLGRAVAAAHERRGRARPARSRRTTRRTRASRSSTPTPSARRRELDAGRRVGVLGCRRSPTAADGRRARRARATPTSTRACSTRSCARPTSAAST